MTENQKCSAAVYDSLAWRSKLCGKPGKVEHEGKWYCGVHNPARLQAIRDKTEQKYRERSEAACKRFERKAAEHWACEGVATELLTPGLLKKLLSNEGETP